MNFSGPHSQGINGPEGFVAGLFVHRAVISQPVSTSREFHDEAVRHIAKNQSGCTPFVVSVCLSSVRYPQLIFRKSVTSSLIRSLHIALKDLANTKIAIIDLHKVNMLNASDHNPHGTSKVHWVESLNLELAQLCDVTGISSR